MDRRLRNNLAVLASLGLILAGMVTLVSYSVTLYRLFCSATGYGGTTQRADAAPAKMARSTVVVRFDTNVDKRLPWRFEPVQRQVTVHLGESTLVYFTAQNLSAQSLVGHATFNVTPAKAGQYFVKIQCFCFNEERLDAGQTVQMPVDFYVDSELARDASTEDVNTITLSYTFFPSSSPDQAKDLSRFAATAARRTPDPARGEALFQQRCVACHSLAQNKIGPRLADVVGRKAGSVPGYAYSHALRDAGLTWTATNLDRWLASPRRFIPGVRMPLGIADSVDRRDIIGFLARRPNRPATASAASDAHH
ncbi:MAG TPA: cytochrome c oxidase assembly protein [Candidatus Sulfotelmatobacter sp.]|nr:cytochrome c oxidase assembly protein [Candidatus Sulfotelmatobacter sp.]